MRLFFHARFFSGVDAGFAADFLEEKDRVAGADVEVASDFAGEGDSSAAEHCCGCDDFHVRFLDCSARQIVAQLDS